MVLGSGAIGIEFASFYRAMGSEVTVIEMMSRILPAEDIEVSKFAQKQMERQGISFMLDAKVSSVEKSALGITARLEVKDGSTHTITTDHLISAVGVEANCQGLGLGEAGVKIERGVVDVDGFGRTSVPGIYAIGDVAGAPMLAHKAEHEGVLCIETIAGLPNVYPLDRSKIPGCTSADPQVASVGMTEDKARSVAFDIRVGRFPFAVNGKAIALGGDQGFIKTIFDRKSGKLIGAHMVGPEVTELIQGFGIAMNLETTEDEFMHTIFPHPTLSESMKESVLAAYDRALNI
jgi:dihydrolipoamide dehydrogenase